MTSNHIINVNITFKNTDATDALKGYASEKVTNCLRKFVHQDTEANVILKVEKNRQIAEVNLHAEGTDFNAHGENEDMYASIDAVVDTLSRQLRKHKEKTRKHH